MIGTSVSKRLRLTSAVVTVLSSLLVTTADVRSAGAERATKDDTIAVELRIDHQASGTQSIGEVTVTIREPISASKAGSSLLRMPLVVSNVKTSAESVSHLQARDEEGALPLTFHDDPAGPEPYRHWIASRTVHGPVEVTYRLPITNNPNPRGAAPPFELRSDGAVFSGLMGGFLMLPDDSKSYRLKLRWNLASLGSDALGVSTLGVGDHITPKAKSAKQLENLFAMAGLVGREPLQPAADGFFSVWQGSPPFDARSLMQWTHRLYDYYLKFFNAGNSAYTIFLRSNPINAGGGVEVGSSFVGTFDEHTNVEDFKLTLAHEMVHTFVGALDGGDPLTNEWFAEGLAVYYERELPLRAGLIDTVGYLKDLNSTVARYYTNILNTTPNSQIAARFWADTRVRVLPYDRGALYFAQLNSEIALASGGRRSLDDLLMAFLNRRKQGKPLTEEAWVSTVVEYAGEHGKQQFEEMMRGEIIQLKSAAFGPCFRRVEAPMRRYELGFTSDVLIEPRRIVRGLVPNSEAAKAGLRDGDEILKPVPQDGIQGNQRATLTLRISREGQTMDVTYLPRGETIDVPQWVTAPACRGKRQAERASTQTHADSNRRGVQLLGQVVRAHRRDVLAWQVRTDIACCCKHL